MAATDPITVFYDGACGLCRREIEHYIRIAPPGVFSWCDISKTPEPFTQLGYRVPDGLRQLHVRDAAGKMHIGIPAFEVIWRALPRWWVLASLMRLPLVRPLASAAYRQFAAWRFHKLGYDSCDLN